MSKYIEISNAGEIELGALLLMGATTKRDDDTKIGHFGTGNKYSIAYMMRNGIPFRVFSGEREILFDVVVERFRERDFKLITIDGKRTSLTTDMGADWEAWFCIREMYSNAIDEGGPKLRFTDEVKPKEGRTCIYIEPDSEMRVVVQHLERFFAFRRTDQLAELRYESEKIRIYPPSDEKVIIYRKGIKVFRSARTGLFDYDFDDVPINEARTLNNMYIARSKLCRALLKTNNPGVVTRLLSAMQTGADWDGTFEHDFDWGDVHYFDLSEPWLAELRGRYLIPHNRAGVFVDRFKEKGEDNYLILPDDMVMNLMTKYPELKCVGFATKDKKKNEHNPPREPEGIEGPMLEYCKAWLKEADYELKYPVFIVEGLGGNVLGLADEAEGQILLNPILFKKGEREIINTLIEENEHLVTKFADETRSFQTHLFELLTHYMGRYRELRKEFINLEHTNKQTDGADSD